MLNKRKNIDLEIFEKILLYVLIICSIYILVYNIFNYDPIEGYDAVAHFQYSEILPRLDGLNPENTYEYFNPPLPYVFPAVVGTVCEKIFSQDLQSCRNTYRFSIQILQFFMFIISLYFYNKTFELFKPKNIPIKLGFVILLVLLTANYKTYAMFRGETYIILLNSILLYRFGRLVKNSFKWSEIDYIIFGVVIGLLALSRQWAFLLFPPYFLMYVFLKKEVKSSYLKFIIFSFSIGFTISAWWYFRSLFEYGSFTAFNISANGFSFSNQPLSFYNPFNSEASFVFTKPIRSNFVNQFLPILYSDLWGDYWGYFSFTSNKLDTGRNQLLIGDYLARVNIVSIIPSITLLAGLRVGYKALVLKVKSNFDIFNALIFLSIISSFSGYLWFLIMYPSYNGNTIKAVYIIQLFHLMCFLSAVLLEKLRNSNKNFYVLILLLLTGAFIHNFSAMLSHYQ